MLCHTGPKHNRASVFRPIKTLPYRDLYAKLADLSAISPCWAKASVGRCEQFGTCMAKYEDEESGICMAKHRDESFDK